MIPGMHPTLKIWGAVLLILGLTTGGAGAQPDAPDVARFFFSGDGRISLVSQKNGAAFEGRYRTGRGRYDSAALAAIDRVFDAPTPSVISLRLVAFIDFLQDRLNPDACITITSGYRPPAYNRKLRNQGGMVAKASLHQYGMAADLKMEGVPARRIWTTVKALGFGGAGYYHGDIVHIDVGPHRTWDEKTSGVDTGISDDNKLIGIVTDYDVYRPGDALSLRFIRMTAFPIAVAAGFVLEPRDSPHTARIFEPGFFDGAKGPCPQFNDIEQMADIHWRFPTGLPPGRYTIRARFCQNPWKDMPADVSTPVFEIRNP
jgi:uncharacterized protein YcbK (DUF882 family)